jgi:ComF family protein
VSIVPLLNLIFPSRCAICNLPGADICSDCHTALQFKPREIWRDGWLGWSVIDYSSEVSKLLVSYKESGQSSLARTFASALESATLLLPNFSDLLWLVPAPSRPENYARRGYYPALLISQQLARSNPRLRTLNCLSFGPGVDDQVGLGFEARQQNLSGKMLVNQPVSGKLCVVVDDVVTSGATALEARRALLSRGAIFVGVLAFSQSGN